MYTYIKIERERYKYTPPCAAPPRLARGMSGFWNSTSRTLSLLL